MVDPLDAQSEPSIDLALIQKILPYAQEKRCRVGDRLLDTGAAADCFYYVQEGTFEVSYMAQQTPIVVAYIGQGKFIGEIGFFDSEVRTRTIQAVADARLRVFDRSAMAYLQVEQPQLYSEFLEFILRSVCARFRRILDDRGPLTAYAASLSTGKELFQGLQPIPADLLGSTILHEITHNLEEFKAEMFDVAYRLQKAQGDVISPDLQAKGEQALDSLKLKMRMYGPRIDDNPAAELIWGYIFKEIFPYLMRSRFAERAYYKPKGYAGDFNMIELLYQNQPVGEGKLGYLVDQWVLNQIPAKAVRARRKLLCRLLEQYCRKRVDHQEKIRVMNLACGPARELCDLLGDGTLSEFIEAVCVDIDPEALQFADQCLRDVKHGAHIHFMNMNVIKWAIGRTQHEFRPQDVIYSSGLCDYLDDRLVSALIKRCHGQLKPDGVLIIGNFSEANPDRFFMDRLLYWRLIHRDKDDFRRLFARSPFGADVEILVEEEGVNLFVVAHRKP